jgi:flagellar basal-body rod protein FlgB
MIGSAFNSTSLGVLEQAMQFAQARHAVLAGNIANLDTPGYRVRDLSVETFQNRLKEAIAARDKASHAPPGGSSGPLEPDAAMRRVRQSLKSILYHDQSDVGIEEQVAELSKNQMMHNMAVSIMSSQFRLLQAAISERV